MKNKPRKVFERVYIHAAKVQVDTGWALILCAMDAYSEFAFAPVLNAEPVVTIEVLNQLFDVILKDYKPMFNPWQIVFVTSLPEEYGQLLVQTKAARHRFVHSKEVTLKAMNELLGGMPMKLVEL
jgi:hypothetical protein